MVRKQIMMIAGEPSGDALGAELVREIRDAWLAQELSTEDLRNHQPVHTGFPPRFFGAGGTRMAAAGVEIDVDLASHAVVGVTGVLRNVRKFRRLFLELRQLAIDRQPHAIVCIDYSGFNLRFARAVRKWQRARDGSFYNWEPRIVQFVSPQVWASRPGRAQHLEEDLDLLLSIFPFEKDWYATRAPRLKVEFTGHPVVDRYTAFGCPAVALAEIGALRRPENPLVLLLPGSRVCELQRHIPVMVETARRIVASRPVEFRMVLPQEELVRTAQGLMGDRRGIQVQVGGLPEALNEADLAIASTGTVMMECAWFGVPVVAMYKTSWLNFEIAKRLVQVGYAAMPNILAGTNVYPEFIQNAATADNITPEALNLLSDETRRREMRVRLARIARSLGETGASRRAAHQIVDLLIDGENRFPLRAYLQAD